MKLQKTILSICFSATMLFFTQKITAQMNVGGGIAYGTEIKTMGIDVTGQYFLKDNIAIEASFTYYMPKDLGNGLGSDYKMKWSEFNANVNYYFNAGSGNIKPYGLGGLNMSFLTLPTFDFGSIFGGGSGVKEETHSEIGLNIGGGADFDLGKNYTPFVQLKYVLSDADQLQILVGVRFSI